VANRRAVKNPLYGPPTWTVSIGNAMLGTTRCRGVFPSLKEAQEYAASEAARSRSSVSFEVYTGTPSNPGVPVGERLHGAHE